MAARKIDWTIERFNAEHMLYEECMTLSEVARHYGVSRQNIDQMIKRHFGLDSIGTIVARRWPLIRTKAFWLPRIEAMYQPTIKALSGGLGINAETARRILDKLGLLPLPSPTRLERLNRQSHGRKECQIWIGPKMTTPAGNVYPTVALGHATTTTYYAHRVAYEQHIGPIPKGHSVLRSCGHSLCIEPDHLYTLADEEQVA